MPRTQFTFYESFAKAILRIKKKADRADAYDAICNYALYGVEPNLDSMSDAAAIAFELIRPNLDASKRKAENGKRKAKQKQTGSKTEANGEQEQTENEKEKEVEIELEVEVKKELEIENECYNNNAPHTPRPGGGAAAAVISTYLDKINPSASQTSLEVLAHYAGTLGEAVCLRAFDVALDSKKATWPYIRGILRRLESQGVKCLADWTEMEEKRNASAGNTPTASGRAASEKDPDSVI